MNGTSKFRIGRNILILYMYFGKNIVPLPCVMQDRRVIIRHLSGFAAFHAVLYVFILLKHTHIPER